MPISDILFGCFVFTIPFQTRLILNAEEAYIGSYFSHHKAIIFYLSDGLFITWLISAIFVDKVRFKGIAYLLPIVWALIALFHVKNYSLGIYNLLRYTEFWLVLAFIRTRKNIINPIIWILVIGGLIQSIIAINQFHVQHGLSLTLLGEYLPAVLDSGAATLSIDGVKILRSYGTMPHPNVLGGWLAIALGLFYYVSRETHSYIGAIFKITGAMILIWGLLVSYSRSAWLAGIVISIVFLIHGYRIYGIKLAFFTTITLIVSCGTLLFSYQQYVFPRASELPSNSQALDYRNQFNAWSLVIIHTQPYTGVGPGQYISELERSQNVQPWQYQPPHNIFLYLWAELGLIGLLLWLGCAAKLCFTWNKVSLLFLYTVPTIIILANLDHYFYSFQQGFILLAIILGILANKKYVSQSVKHILY